MPIEVSAARAVQASASALARVRSIYDSVYLLRSSLGWQSRLAGKGAEEAERFVTALLERGMDDMALFYLEKLPESGLTNPAVLEKLPLLQARTSINAAKTTPQVARRETLMRQAADKLGRYAAAHPDDVSAMELQGELAGTFVQQARAILGRKPTSTTGGKASELSGDLRTQARQLINEAKETYQQVITGYQSQLEKLPKSIDARKEAEKLAKRDEFRGRLAQARILHAQTGYYLAQTYPSETTEFRELNQTTAKELGELYAKYSRWLVGFVAHLYEGRCYQAIGDTKRARGCYESIVSQPDQVPEFRNLIADTYRYLAECLIAEGQLESAAAQTSAWLKRARGAEETKPQWLAVRYQLAEAFRLLSERPETGGTARRRLQSDARRQYLAVSRSGGEFQRPAREALLSLGGRTRDDTSLPKRFAEAIEAGRTALREAQTAQLAITTAERNSPDQVDELEAQQREANRRALQLFAHALTVAPRDKETQIGDLNDARYYVAWLAYQLEDYYRAAVAGEFVGTRYPEHQYASAAIKVAMASYEKMYQLARAEGASKEETNFEASQLARVAQFITRRWPNSPDADAALTVLLDFALRNDRLDEARRLLESIPADRRPATQVRLGAALWQAYLKNSRVTEARLSRSELTQLAGEAKTLLRDGLDAIANRGDNINTNVIFGALSLAQCQLRSGDVEAALRTLEDPQIGPLRYASGTNETQLSLPLAREIYKAALRAYLSISPPRPDKALGMIDAIERLVSDDRTQNATLANMYVSLGQQLKIQIESAHERGNATQATNLSNAFADFLQRIEDRASQADWNVLLWVANSYYDLGELRLNASGDNAGASDDFGKSLTLIRFMLDRAAREPDYAPNQTAILAAKLQLGRCLTMSGEFKSALDIFSAMLREKETRLDVQIAAAYTFQRWGEMEDPRRLNNAIFGGYRVRSTGKNRIWGWVRIASIARSAMSRRPQLKDSFFEARYNAVYCRYLLGTKSEQPAKNEHFAKARSVISAIKQLYPDFGGEPWTVKFTNLSQQISPQ